MPRIARALRVLFVVRDNVYCDAFRAVCHAARPIGCYHSDRRASRCALRKCGASHVTLHGAFCVSQAARDLLRYAQHVGQILCCLACYSWSKCDLLCHAFNSVAWPMLCCVTWRLFWCAPRVAFPAKAHVVFRYGTLRCAWHLMCGLAWCATALCFGETSTRRCTACRILR